MPLIQISNEQRDAATAQGNDAADAFEFGIYDEGMVQFAPPLPEYAGFTPTIKQTVKDGIKQFYAILSRELQPIGASTADTAPSYTISSDTQVASLAVTTYIPRKVMIQLNLSTYTDVANTAAGFYVKINGSGLPPALQYFFNVASDHRSMGGSWVTQLPGPGIVTITAWVGVASGPGSIILDPNDTISLSVIG